MVKATFPLRIRYAVLAAKPPREKFNVWPTKLAVAVHCTFVTGAQARLLMNAVPDAASARKLRAMTVVAEPMPAGVRVKVEPTVETEVRMAVS